MLSSCRISGAAVSGRLCQPTAFIRSVRYWVRRIFHSRLYREGVDRPHHLPADWHDPSAVSRAYRLGLMIAALLSIRSAVRVGEPVMEPFGCLADALAFGSGAEVHNLAVMLWSLRRRPEERRDAHPARSFTPSALRDSHCG